MLHDEMRDKAIAVIHQARGEGFLDENEAHPLLAWIEAAHGALAADIPDLPRPARASASGPAPPAGTLTVRGAANERDLVYEYDEGRERDGGLLHFALCHADLAGDGQSLTDKLKARGYDLATVRFSVGGLDGDGGSHATPETDAIERAVDVTAAG